MIPGGVGLMAWESRVLAGLSIWTVKLLELVAGFGVEKSKGLNVRIRCNV